MNDNELRDVIDRRQAANDVIDEQEAIRQDCNVQIGTELALRGVDKAAVGPWTCQIVDMTRGIVNKLKLLEKGVDPDLIEECTDRIPVMQIRVNRRRGAVPTGETGA